MRHQSEFFAKLLFSDGDHKRHCLGLMHAIHFVPFGLTHTVLSIMFNLSQFDLSQFAAAVLAETAIAHCETCGEVVDRYDRCGCDY
jgi:hypothetical protein